MSLLMIVFCILMSMRSQWLLYVVLFFFSSRRRHTRCALVTGVQTCALPIFAGELVDPGGKDLAPRRAELEAGFAQRRPHHVLERAHLVQNRTPRHQEIGRASCRERVCQYV